MSEKVKVDIWSDVACPWCYVGKRRFETALAGFSGRDDAPEVEIEYHSFELAPDTPVDFEGTEVDFLAKHKGMPAGQVEQMLGQMTTVAAAEGLAYDFDALQHTKTLKAHELLHFAKSQGKQVEMKERLLKAYFEQGRHVGRIEELAALAAEVGLDADEVRTVLENGDFEDDVEQDIAQARAYGISGVPFFVFNGKYGVSGAQDPAVFTQVLDQVVADAAESVA
ncbi:MULTISPECIES: DsbA family oxidoreductase [Oerskovia]|uniref:DSBA-like thioredoxin domain protein n=1 Tax=Oerskovia enterophila TaxID=43678 RepID=A0A163Q2Q0_9CELL|nr:MULTISPECIES: DsbA family oxidoreductase [Oerskovia]KRC33037.1 disulfide bond formation protein DsbA [Oerskovia sp. Root22]KRD35795.1 disulfide bond formation protein DsbA [Oerskovia sp. Root918]KZM33741.1 DSBA-like thioredoxin domain protein [Oerskovia enterophila]OCI33119.1 DSBA-like thioredoxin domain protein [Oerskovia enterophila]